MKTKIAGLICLAVLTAQVHVFASGGPATGNKGPASANNSPASVNEKLIKSFQDAFPLAEKVEWKENGANYIVYFKEQAVLSEIEYDHDGNFIASDRYYKDASLLPLHLAWELHKKYANKTIFGITEMNTESETEYYVKLEDSKEWVTVKGSSDGLLVVVDRVQKQP